MICQKCKAEVKDTSKFCTNCGEPLYPIVSHSADGSTNTNRRCTACGAIIAKSAKFCTSCGTKQEWGDEAPKDLISQSIAQDKKSPVARRRVIGIGCLIVAGTIACICMALYYMTGVRQDSDEMVNAALENLISPNLKIEQLHAIQNAEDMATGLIYRLLEIYSESGDIGRHCSKEFRSLDSQAEMIAYKNDMILDYREVDIWTDAQDYTKLSIKIEYICLESEYKALIRYTVTDSLFGFLSDKTATMVYEDNNWYVDDLRTQGQSVSEKEYIKDFINENEDCGSDNRCSVYVFDGVIEGKYPIAMELRVQDGQISGAYHYTKTGNGGDLELVGSVSECGEWNIDEYDGDHNLTGSFSGIYSCGIYSGIFTTANGKSMSFNCTVKKSS